MGEMMGWEGMRGEGEGDCPGDQIGWLGSAMV